MEMKCFLTAIIVSFAVTVEAHNSIENQFTNLFDSIAKKNYYKRSVSSENYFGPLEKNVAKEQKTFKMMKEELSGAKMRNAYKSKILYENVNNYMNGIKRKRMANGNDGEPKRERNINHKAMVRDLTNLRLADFVDMLCSTLGMPLHGANETTYLFCLEESFRFGQVGEQIMPANMERRDNLVLTTDTAYYIIQFSVNKSGEEALARTDAYRSRFLNEGREVLCMGLDYRFIGSSRVSMQDRIVCSWVAELFSPNGTLLKSFPAQEEVYKRFAVKSDKNDNFQSMKRQPIEAFYDVLEAIGSGEHSRVHACRDKRTGNPYAVKFEYVYWPSHITKEKIFREVDMMRLLDHPNLIRLYDSFETDEEIAMIIDLMSGGTLYERKKSETGSQMTEEVVVNIMKQVAAGIKYLHDQHFVHFDLQPANIMCQDETCAHVKIIDFGKAGRLDTISLDYEKGYLAQNNFTAPEVIEGKRVGFYTDTWALGITTYFLISGGYPYKTVHDTEVPKHIDESALFREVVFDKISNECKDFIRRLLVEDRTKRMTAEQSVNHPWLTGGSLVQG